MGVKENPLGDCRSCCEALACVVWLAKIQQKKVVAEGRRVEHTRPYPAYRPPYPSNEAVISVADRESTTHAQLASIHPLGIHGCICVADTHASGSLAERR